MVTFVKMPHRWDDGTYDLGFTGKSTDTKPTGACNGMDIANGSSFFEYDTLKVSFYDLSTESWVTPKGQSVSASSGTSTVTDIEATASVDDTSGTPAVTITKSETDEGGVNFDFAFTGLKGADGSGSGGTATLSDDVTVNNSLNVGANNTISGKKSTATGDNNVLNNSFEFAAGGANNVSGQSSAAIGQGNTVTGDQCVAIGNANKVSGTGVVGIGYQLPEIKDSPFPLMVGNTRLGFAVVGNEGLKTTGKSGSGDTDGGIIIQGRDGATIKYYRLTIIGGSLSITDVTSKINFV